MKRCIFFLILLCVLLCGAAAADTGYTRVSMIPGAVDFTWDMTVDERGDPVIVTDYPFKAADAMAMQFIFCEAGGEWRAEFRVTEDGETLLYGFSEDYAGDGEADEAEVLFAVMRDLKNGTITPEAIIIYGQGESWSLQYQVSENRYQQYCTYTALEDAVYLEQIIAFSETGGISSSTVNLTRDKMQLYLYYGKYGTLLDSDLRIEEDGAYYYIEYDDSTGLFGEEPIETFGFSASDLTDHIPAALSIPERSDNVSLSLSGGGDITVRVNEPFVVRKSDFSLFPADSLIAGYAGYEDASFDVFGSNGLFYGKSEIERIDPESADTALRIIPLQPGYYSVWAFCDFYDEVNEADASLRSDYFLLTVLNEDGSEPEKPKTTVTLFRIPSGTVGETIQINWHTAIALFPYENTIQIEKDGVLLESWSYEETRRDTCTLSETGTYTVRVTVSGKNFDPVSAEMTLNVTDPFPLELKSLLLSKDEKTEGRLNWTLDYTGGMGTKTTDLQLINVLTGETVAEDGDGNFAQWFASGLPAGVYQLKMNVRDDAGDHPIESNQVTLLPEWDLVLPSSVETIADSAFRGISDVTVYIPEGCTQIGAGAFAESAVTAIFIPSTVREIAKDALPAGTVICTTAGSPVIGWAGTDYPVMIVE